MSTTVSSQELQRSFGAVLEKAQAAPVIVTKYDRPSVVILAVEEYRRLLRGNRRAYRVAEMPAEKAERIMTAPIDPELERFDHEMG